MNNQPIDPRALKAAKQFRAEVVGLSDESTEQLARIIQSHFAESVNGKLLEALENLVEGFTPEADFEFHDPKCPALFGTWKDCNCPSLKDWREAREAIALTQSQPPSMADELAEALRAEMDIHIHDVNCQCPHHQLLARYDAQKGQS
jgi:hypothetical protein